MPRFWAPKPRHFGPKSGFLAPISTHLAQKLLILTQQLFTLRHLSPPLWTPPPHPPDPTFLLNCRQSLHRRNMTQHKTTYQPEPVHDFQTDYLQRDKALLETFTTKTHQRSPGPRGKTQPRHRHHSLRRNLARPGPPRLPPCPQHLSGLLHR